MVVILDFYFENIKLFWPYDLYKFSEDLALTYLVRKNYDIELALAMISKCVFLSQARPTQLTLCDCVIHYSLTHSYHKTHCIVTSLFIVVDLDDLVDMMRKQDDRLDRNL